MIFLALSIISGDLIINNLAFFELKPKYECQFSDNPGVWSSCTPEDFCQEESDRYLTILEHRVDWSDKLSLDNWITRLEM